MEGGVVLTCVGRIRMMGRARSGESGWKGGMLLEMERGCCCVEEGGGAERG